MDLSAYRNVALQFSGGKDSLACLYLLREQLDDITVYWLDTGDTCPETVAVLDQVRSWVPNFVAVRTDSKNWRAANGYPSDLVPAKAHTLGVAYGMNDFRLVGRFDCCYANLMLPMHERMVEDGVDCVIRGTKLCDTGRVPAEGNVGSYTVILPIRDWSHQQVFDYLESVGAPYNEVYDHFVGISAPECLTCTAWWDDNKGEYLKARHPEQYVAYRKDLKIISIALQSHLADLAKELGD